MFFHISFVLNTSKFSKSSIFTITKLSTLRMFNLKRFLRGFIYAFRGIRQLLITQQNIRIHLLAAIVAVIMGFCFRISATEWMVIVILIGAVFAAESFNTAIEFLVDKVSPEQDPLAGKVKDIAAAAVLIMAIAALIAGLIIFIPKILQSL